MAARVAHACFEKFQKARLDFVAEVADLATKPHYVDHLQDEGVITQLKPLLKDTFPSVSQTAAAALAKIASYTPELAEELVTSDILVDVVEGLKTGNIPFRKAGVSVLRAVAKHSSELAMCVTEAGSPDVLAALLEEFDAGVREVVAATIAAISAHGAELGQVMVDAGVVNLLVVCLQEPEVGLKRACAAALGEISNFAPELAVVVAGTGAVPHLVTCLRHADAKVKRQACFALAQVAKHSTDLAEVVVESGTFPAVFECLQDPDGFVRKNAAIVCREVVKHSEELAGIVVKGGGAPALVEYVNASTGSARLPGVLALGYIGSFSESLSSAVLGAVGVEALKAVLIAEPEDHMKAAAVWALGQCGKHDADHANALADGDALRHILAALLHEESSDDLRLKAKRALKAVGDKCTHLGALQSLLPTAPVPVLKVLLARFEHVIPEDAAQRRELVASGGLKIIQSLDRSADPAIELAVEAINSNYPADVVEYCSPGFADTLADRITA